MEKSNIAELLTMNVKKLNKVAQFETLKKLLVGEVAGLSTVEKAQLLQAFIPPKPAKPKNSISWVNRGVGVSDVRYYLRYSYLRDDGIYCATNGSFLLITENHNLENRGFYCSKSGEFLGNEDDMRARFPDIRRVIPDENSEDFINADEFERRNNVFIRDGKNTNSYDFVKGDLNIRFDKKLLDVVESNPSPVKKFLIREGKAAALIVFENGDIGVIMPLAI